MSDDSLRCSVTQEGTTTSITFVNPAVHHVRLPRTPRIFTMQTGYVAQETDSRQFARLITELFADPECCVFMVGTLEDGGLMVTHLVMIDQGIRHAIRHAVGRGGFSLQDAHDDPEAEQPAGRLWRRRRTRLAHRRR